MTIEDSLARLERAYAHAAAIGAIKPRPALPPAGTDGGQAEPLTRSVASPEFPEVCEPSGRACFAFEVRGPQEHSRHLVEFRATLCPLSDYPCGGDPERCWLRAGGKYEPPG